MKIFRGHHRHPANRVAIVGRLVAAAVMLQLFPQVASGAVGSGIRALPFPGNYSPVVLSETASSAWAKVSATQNGVQSSNSPNTCEQDGQRRGEDRICIFPPGSKPYGLSYGEWSARWWQWLLQIPASTNPNLDATGAHCAEGQSGHVWFLAGSFGTLPSPVMRTCTIPAGKSVLLPVLNQADGAALLDCGGPAPFDVPCAAFTFNGQTGVAALREEAKVSQDNPALLQLSVDGVPVNHLSYYRAQSPVFSFSLTTNNVISFLLAAFGFPGTQPPGTYTPAVSDGYWVMLTPPSPGKHTIHFEGVQAGGFATGGITYLLTVLP